MADSQQFYRDLRNTINQFVVILDSLVTLQDRLNSDSSLAASAATAAQALGRTDLVAADFTNAAGAVGQINFTFGSGSPTQKSFLYKIL